MKEYIAIIHKENKTDYGVSFPDFPGCITAATSLEKAKDLAQEALQMHVDGMKEDGEKIPAASTLDVVEKNKLYEDSLAFITVKVKIGKSHSKRVNVTFDEDLLEEIDNRAESLHKNRSAYLADLARAEIKYGFPKEHNSEYKNSILSTSSLPSQ